MRYYVTIIHHEPGCAYGVLFPDVPGCYSAGDSLSEAIENAKEALILFSEEFKGPMPAPRSYDEIMASGDYDDEDVIVAMTPCLDTSGHSVKANVTFEAGLLNAIDEAAKERRLTRAAFLAQAARKEILGTDH